MGYSFNHNLSSSDLTSIQQDLLHTHKACAVIAHNFRTTTIKVRQIGIELLGLDIFNAREYRARELLTQSIDATVKSRGMTIKEACKSHCCPYSSYTKFKQILASSPKIEPPPSSKKEDVQIISIADLNDPASSGNSQMIVPPAKGQQYPTKSNPMVSEGTPDVRRNEHLVCLQIGGIELCFKTHRSTEQAAAEVIKHLLNRG